VLDRDESVFFERKAVDDVEQGVVLGEVVGRIGVDDGA